MPRLRFKRGGAPFIVGAAHVGTTVQADGSTGDTYQWLRNGVAIPGATSKTYTIVSADKGTTLSYQRTSTSAGVAVPVPWAVDPAGTLGGKQFIGHRAGMYPQAALNTSGNWGPNGSVRATESEHPYTAQAAVNDPEFVWFNSINGMDPANGSLGITRASCSTQMGVVQPDGATVQALDLRDYDAPTVSLGNGVATPVVVAPEHGLRAVPPVAFSVAKGDVVKARLYVDRGTDVTTARFPKQCRQDLTNDPGTNGASQQVTGPGTSHAHSSVAAWNALAYGALGLVMPAGLIGTPAAPIANVLIIGDSIPNKSLDTTTQPDWNIAYIKRAITTLEAGGTSIVGVSIAQGNDTLVNLLADLQSATSVRGKLLRAGCWTHVHIDTGHNDIQNGRTAPQVNGDFGTLIALVRSTCPAGTKISMNTLPPYTTAANSRLSAAVMDAVLAWQLSGTTGVDWLGDGGAICASASNRQLWPDTALGDAGTHHPDGIHPDAFLSQQMANFWATANPGYWSPFS